MLQLHSRQTFATEPNHSWTCDEFRAAEIRGESFLERGSVMSPGRHTSDDTSHSSAGSQESERIRVDIVPRWLVPDTSDCSRAHFQRWESGKTEVHHHAPSRTTDGKDDFRGRRKRKIRDKSSVLQPRERSRHVQAKRLRAPIMLNLPMSMKTFLFPLPDLPRPAKPGSRNDRLRHRFASSFFYWTLLPIS